MSAELFHLQPTLSPRLQWLAKHRLETAYDAGLANEGEREAWSCYSLDNGGGIAIGASETEAIYAYCERYGLKHWSLEP